MSFGAAAVLAGFVLLAPPLFVLAPFVLLTLASRPRTVRELFWIVAAGVGVGLALQGPRDIAADLIRACGVALGAVFVLLSLRSRASLISRGLLAVVLTALAIGIWEWSRGIGWPDVHKAFTTMLREGYQAMASSGAPGSPPKPELQSFVQPFIDAAGDLARALPGLLALEGLAGAALAWLWHHRIAASPLGLPPAPFRQFRFNDHLIWGAIFTLAVLLVPVPAEATVLAENLLILWVGLYAVRGLAVAAAVLAPVPLLLRVSTAVLALLLSPLSLGVCLAVGLADTWLDIRRRLPPPAPEGARS